MYRQRRLPVDVILDQTPVDNETNYKNAALGTTKVLNGLKYVVLRDEFLKCSSIRRKRKKAKKLLITFGGSDNAGGTVKVLEALQSRSYGVALDIVIGPANPYGDRIAKLAGELEDSEVHVATNKMAEIIANADLAVSAGWNKSLGVCIFGVANDSN